MGKKCLPGKIIDGNLVRGTDQWRIKETYMVRGDQNSALSCFQCRRILNPVGTNEPPE